MRMHFSEGTTMSVEAFAMGDANYMESAINHYALEESFKQPQSPHAMPETEQKLSPKVDKSHSTGLSFEIGMEWVKMKMREWAKAVASNNEMKANVIASEISLIMDNHLMRGR